MSEPRTPRTGRESVVIVIPPVLYPGLPMLGPSLLVPSLNRAGVSARAYYANVQFAGRVGFKMCQRLASAAPRSMIGEAVFLTAAFPDRAADHPRLLGILTGTEDPLSRVKRLEPLSLEEARWCATEAEAHVREAARQIVDGRPKIVGISAMVQQTIPSIAIARAVKALDPEIVTIYGGANATEPMASAMLEMTDVFDFVFSGEADVAFPEFCKRYLEQGKLPPKKQVIRCSPVQDMNLIPTPDYDDYFAEVEPFRGKDEIATKAPSFLIFESSRGCWWGDKFNCTFCGYNANGMTYRSRAPEQVLDDLATLEERYGVNVLFASDNIMAQNFPKTVLQGLIDRGSDYWLSYEVKANLKESDLDTFVKAGVWEIQPGIESLSSHVLQVMLKGVKAAENVRFLRDLKSRNLTTVWNILWAFPGETCQDYVQQMEVLPLLSHLEPPTRWGPIRISRYSPYHSAPEKYGIKALRPWEAYDEFFGPYASRLAHHFYGDYDTEFTRDTELVQKMDAAIHAWANLWRRPEGPPRLEGRRTEEGWLVVEDTRPIAKAPRHILSPPFVEALEFLRYPKPEGRLEEGMKEEIEVLLETGLVLRIEDTYVSLVTQPYLAEKLWKEREEIMARAVERRKGTNGRRVLAGEPVQSAHNWEH